MPFDADAVRRWLDDIHRHIVLAETFAEGMDYDALRADLCKTYAVTRCLEIISEASRRLPDALKDRTRQFNGAIWRRQQTSIAINTKM